MRIARIVDHDVEPAERLLGGCHHRLGIGASRNVGAERDGALTDLIAHRLGALPVQVGDHHARALAHEMLDDGTTKARCGAGDDSGFPF